MRLSAKGFTVAASIAMAGLFGPALAADPSYLTIGAGSWETFRDHAHATELNVSYRSNIEWWIFKPHAGVTVATDGDYFGYAGILTDVYLGKHIVLSPNFAVGGYGGHGYRLGSHVEFRSGGDVAWRFEDTSRLGLGVYHISNAGLTQRNPGEESFLLEYFYPLR
ncbi:MAG TPA: acyloxyacyl hydrolase [Telmatospirillum sp.]|nr:acyloxyacyl hydrolase [Telmatospirillum sp.]